MLSVSTYGSDLMEKHAMTQDLAVCGLANAYGAPPVIHDLSSEIEQG